MRSRCALTCLSVLVLSGCAADDDDDLTFAVPTEIAVAPDDFLGDVPCSAFEGAVKSYVVTLHVYDDADDTTPFTLGSSLPTPCSAVVGFRDVIVIGKRYTATIDAYDVPAASLSPFGGTSSGSRQMLLDGEPVTPRWSTACGGSPESAPVATVNERVFVRPCEPLTGAAGDTGLAVGASDVLGADPCSLATSIDLVFETGGLPDTTGLACDAEPVVFAAEPGAQYSIYATAEIEGVVHGAVCSAEAVEGVTVRPSCAAPSPLGSATISLAGVGDPPVCPAGAWFDLFAEEALLNATPLPCGGTAAVGPFQPGPATFVASVYDTMGAVTAQASCSVAIEPGKTKGAVCLAAP